MILPFPPSVNHYWRMARGRFYISKAGADFRKAVCAIVAHEHCPRLDGPLEVEIVAVLPDRRRRDVDNMLKAALDAMQHAGLYGDDSQIVKLSIEKRRGVGMEDPCLYVEVKDHDQ